MVSMPLDSNWKQALSLGTPVEVFDPATNEVYYVLSAEQFQVLSSRGGTFDPRDGYPFVDKVMAEDDAADPLLDSYQ